ncbi:MAG: transcriptional repressor [Clostridium sp.]|jgi:Fur family peroxide stress response transcriptional regulator|nr:transcriptional repressor [Clostridium sp.]
MALKHSRQRELIKEFLMTRKDHPTADEVYRNVRQRSPNISLGTVYRNLSLLSDRREIRRLRLGDGVDRFDADVSEHHHFVCGKCGKVTDLVMDDIDGVVEVAGAHFDGEITGYVAHFYGICGECCREGRGIARQTAAAKDMIRCRSAESGG